MRKENIDLQAYNTFGISETAKLLFEIHSLDDLLANVTYLIPNKFMVLGGGSNVLFVDSPKQTIFLNRIKGITVKKKEGNHVFVNVGAGETWHDFVMFSLQQNWGGLENLSLIPGSVGASPIQNIGAYGVEVKDLISEVIYFDIDKNEVVNLNNEACEFGYRDSIFKNALKGKAIVLEVCFKLTLNEHNLNVNYGAIQSILKEKNINSPSIKDISDAVIAIRSSKLPDPRVLGNAGSFFKNPIVPIIILREIQKQFETVPFYEVDSLHVKIPAGWLIEQCGWKGKKVGNCGVHKNQALVIVNHGGASGQEIWNLSENIINDVHTKFGITLEREVTVYP